MVERPAFRGQDSVVVVGGSMNSVVTQAHDFFHATAELNDACRDVLQGRINSYETLENLVISLRMCETKYDTFKDNGWTFVPPPNHTVGFVPVTSLVPRDNSKLNEERNWAVILNVFDNRDDIRKLWSKKRAYYKKREEISRGQTIVTALIYAASRLIILILAFAALRKQDARLYQETWTSNLLHGG